MSGFDLSEFSSNEDEGDHVSDEDAAAHTADSDSEALSDYQPSPKKPKTMPLQPKKISGAAYYNTKFNKSWVQKYGCIQPVRNDNCSFLCTVCNKRISCKHQGETDITRHIATASHLSLAKQLESQSRLSFQSSSSSLDDKVR